MEANIMTSRQMWEDLLIELNKVNAPSMLLQDFNYLANKALTLYINKKYNIYEINLQTTDDLMFLKSSAILTLESSSESETSDLLAKLYGSHEVCFPADYLHILNCICVYKLRKKYKCYNKEDYVQFPAKKLISDSWPVIMNDYYNRPLPERPYYYIYNTPKDDITNPSTDENYLTVSKDTSRSNLLRTINLAEIKNEPVVKESNTNQSSNVRCEIRCGNDSSVFELTNVIIDYIKTPLIIKLTQEQIDSITDTSQIIEAPDYVCQEIINELVMLVLENTSNPRLLTNTVVTQSIANPAQQLTQ